MTGNITTLRFLVDEVGVKTLNSDCKGYTPLQMAVVWGQVDILVYLLTRGAEPNLWMKSSVVDQARRRQTRLEASLSKAEEYPDSCNLDPQQILDLFEKGKVMLEAHTMLGLCEIAAILWYGALDFDNLLRPVALLSDGEHRRLWRFVMELQQDQKPKAKTRATNGYVAKAALLALPRTKRKAAAEATIEGVPRAAFADGLQLIFHEALPDTAFVLVASWRNWW
eukprot:g29546.t1